MRVSVLSGPRVGRFRRGAGLLRSATAGRVVWVSMGHSPSDEERLLGERTLAAQLTRGSSGWSATWRGTDSCPKTCYQRYDQGYEVAQGLSWSCRVPLRLAPGLALRRPAGSARSAPPQPARTRPPPSGFRADPSGRRRRPSPLCSSSGLPAAPLAERRPSLVSQSPC